MFCYTYIACIVTCLFEFLGLSVIPYNAFTYDVLSFCPPFSGKNYTLNFVKFSEGKTLWTLTLSMPS
jgi:hypothetical protein